MYVLQKVPGSHKDYWVKEQFEYVDEHGKTWIVPDALDPPFQTDLASIPSIAAWLVPKDGRHTPAALVHDAMIYGDEGPRYEPKAPPVTPGRADDIFREGMKHLGVAFLRRWMMWAAVTIGTVVKVKGLSRLFNGLRLLLGFAAFLAIGVYLFADALDFTSLDLGMDNWRWFRGETRWLREQFNNEWAKMFWSTQPDVPFLVSAADNTFWPEVGRFLEVAVLASVAYALVWFERWRFGLILGLSLSLIAYAMFIPLVGFLVYLVLEETVGWILAGFRAAGLYRGAVSRPITEWLWGKLRKKQQREGRELSAVPT